MGARCRHGLSGLVDSWSSVDDPSRAAAVQDEARVSVVVDATSLHGGHVAGAVQALLDALCDRPQSSLRRVVHVVPLRWLGRAARPADAGVAAFVVAAARARALRQAPARCTVNTVVVPDEFPGAPPPASAPIRRPIDVADLTHALRYLLDPDNDYVTGQVVSICGGDDAWSNGGF